MTTREWTIAHPWGLGNAMQAYPRLSVGVRMLAKAVRDVFPLDDSHPETSQALPLGVHRR